MKNTILLLLILMSFVCKAQINPESDLGLYIEEEAIKVFPASRIVMSIARYNQSNYDFCGTTLDYKYNDYISFRGLPKGISLEPKLYTARCSRPVGQEWNGAGYGSYMYSINANDTSVATKYFEFEASEKFSYSFSNSDFSIFNGKAHIVDVVYGFFPCKGEFESTFKTVKVKFVFVKISKEEQLFLKRFTEKFIVTEEFFKEIQSLIRKYPKSNLIDFYHAQELKYYAHYNNSPKNAKVAFGILLKLLNKKMEDKFLANTVSAMKGEVLSLFDDEDPERPLFTHEEWMKFQKL